MNGNYTENWDKYCTMSTVHQILNLSTLYSTVQFILQTREDREKSTVSIGNSQSSQIKYSTEIPSCQMNAKKLTKQHLAGRPQEVAGMGWDEMRQNGSERGEAIIYAANDEGEILAQYSISSTEW